MQKEKVPLLGSFRVWQIRKDKMYYFRKMSNTKLWNKMVNIRQKSLGIGILSICEFQKLQKLRWVNIFLDAFKVKHA